MADTEVKASLSEPDQLTDTPVVAQRAELEVEQSKHGQVKLNETTVRTHTIIVDATSSTSTDVGVQATPAAVSGDSNLPQKPQRGILPVTSDMRNSATKDTQNHIDNHASATNTKEKTPMCLVNELARYNKLPHKYVLVDEKGPAHKKEFKIRLDLGTENYHATGSSIKRAQHAAAEVAISITKLKRPTAKPPRVETPPLAAEKKKPPVVTPTVELNALAMKLGERPEYANLDTHMPPRPFFYPPMTDFYYRFRMPPPPMYPGNPYMHAHMRPRMPTTYSVVLKIGRRQFRGNGPTRQQARHNAASRALKVLKNIQLHPQTAYNPNQKCTDDQTAQGSDGETAPASNSDGAGSPSSAPSSPVTVSSEDMNGTVKSEISLIHEMALRLGKTVKFEVIHESGPPHMRNFVTRCICGDLTSEGEGNSKRKSKKIAAEVMLTKLKDQEQPTVLSKQRVKNIANKKKNRNLIKMQKANVDYGSGINPISRLIQIQQANKRKEPVYSLVMEHGLPRRREFIMQVECNDRSCQGKGPNKKLAKRNAAEQMLQLMGYSQPSPAPGKSVLKSPDHTGHSTHHNKHVTFFDSTQTSKVPGVIVRKDTSGNTLSHEMPPFKADLAASLAKELLEKGKSVVGETLLPAKEHPKNPLKRPREQLEYLGSCMGFAIEFTDFPKGTNTNQCLTVVSLQTNPSQVFHGSASSVDESHDKAALQALNKLAQSARDDDSVDDTTPPVARIKVKVAAESNASVEDSNGAGDGAVPATNGDMNGSESNCQTQHKSEDTVSTQCSVTVEGDAVTVP